MLHVYKIHVWIYVVFMISFMLDFTEYFRLAIPERYINEYSRCIMVDILTNVLHIWISKWNIDQCMLEEVLWEYREAILDPKKKNNCCKICLKIMKRMWNTLQHVLWNTSRSNGNLNYDIKKQSILTNRIWNYKQ